MACKVGGDCGIGRARRSRHRRDEVMKKYFILCNICVMFIHILMLSCLRDVVLCNAVPILNHLLSSFIRSSNSSLLAFSGNFSLSGMTGPYSTMHQQAISMKTAVFAFQRERTRLALCAAAWAAALVDCDLSCSFFPSAALRPDHTLVSIILKDVSR